MKVENGACTSISSWPSGQYVKLAIQQSRVWVPLWPLSGFVLSHTEFKSLATLVNSQLVATCQLEFLILFLSIWVLCLQTSWITKCTFHYKQAFKPLNTCRIKPSELKAVSLSRIARENLMNNDATIYNDDENHDIS